MLTLLKDRPRMMHEAQRAKLKPYTILHLVIMTLLFFVAQVAGAIFASTSMLISTGSVDNEGVFTMFSLYGTIFSTILAVLFCLLIERRSLSSMGLGSKSILKKYLQGFIIGFVLFSFITITSCLSGSLKFNGYTLANGFPLLLLFLGGYLIQGMSEEVLLRGYFMVSVGNRRSILFAIISNSVVFGLLHFLNPGFTFLPFVNLVLFGIFASCYALKENSLWGICALHSSWNFVQGNIFGINVSGMELPVSVFSFTVSGEANIWNGGSFGMEGSIVTTIVLSLATIYILWKKDKESHVAKMEAVNDAIHAN